MSFYLQAPHELIQTTTKLPNPAFGDSRGLDVVLNRKRAIDGTLYTNVKTTGKVKLEYQFLMYRSKALELKEFIRAYADKTIRITDHNDDVWKVNLVIDSNAFTEVGVNMVDVRLEFIGVQLNV